MGIVAKRRRERHVDAGAGEIDRRVEGVAAARDGEAPVGAARELDHHFPDRDDAVARLAHALLAFPVCCNRRIIEDRRHALKREMRRSAPSLVT